MMDQKTKTKTLSKPLNEYSRSLCKSNWNMLPESLLSSLWDSPDQCSATTYCKPYLRQLHLSLPRQVRRVQLKIHTYRPTRSLAYKVHRVSVWKSWAQHTFALELAHSRTTQTLTTFQYPSRNSYSRVRDIRDSEEWKRESQQKLKRVAIELCSKHPIVNNFNQFLSHTQFRDRERAYLPLVRDCVYLLLFAKTYNTQHTQRPITLPEVIFIVLKYRTSNRASERVIERVNQLTSW